MSLELDRYRREIKIPLGHADALRLEAALLDSPWPLRSPYPDRQVNSYYYDSRDGRDYADNAAGIARRTKLRFRWYGAVAGEHPVVLEAKLKHGFMNRKETIALGPRPTSADRFDGFAALAGTPVDPTNAARCRARPERRLLVRYHRRYLVDAAGLRVTIDRDIHYADGRLRAPLLLASPVHTVVELKFPDRLTDRASQLLERLPFRAFRHSKYVVGVDLVGV